jgi:predicted DCC family thiol-disulfide oxidoreductase YuxK
MGPSMGTAAVEERTAPSPAVDPAGAAFPIVFFDGVCNLCNGAVNFLLDRDRDRRLRFAPLQGRTFEALRAAHSGLAGLDSLVLVDAEGLHIRSEAALRLSRYLGLSWRLLGRLGLLVPRALRDWLYDRVARNRYRWFGRRDSCRIPTPELRARFLD